MKFISATFVKKGEYGKSVWDCDQYKAFLNKAAGDGGILNREERIAILERMDKGNNKPVDDNTHDDGNHNDGDGDGNNVRPSCNVVVDETEGENVTIPTLTRKQTKRWDATALTVYPCLVQKYGTQKAVRMLKLAQGIRDGNYSAERMEKLYKATLGLKKEADIKAYKEEGFDSAYYYDMFSGTDLPDNVFAPAEIGECPRKANAEVGKVTIKKYAKTRKTGHTSYTGYKKAGDTTISFCGDEAQKINPNEVDSKIAEYKKRNPDKDVRVEDRRKR